SNPTWKLLSSTGWETGALAPGLKAVNLSRRRSALVVTPPVWEQADFATPRAARASSTRAAARRKSRLLATPRRISRVSSSSRKESHHSAAGLSVDAPRIDVVAQVFVDSSVCALTLGPQTKINPHRKRTDLTTSAFRCAFTGLLLSSPSSWNSSGLLIRRYRHPSADRHRPKAHHPERDRSPV